MAGDEQPVQRRQKRGSVGECKFQIRVPEDVLEASKQRAVENGETLSAAVVAFLRQYSR